VAGGRRTSKATGHVFDLTVDGIVVFDFETGNWLPESECPVLPTPRAGNSTVEVDGLIHETNRPLASKRWITPQHSPALAQEQP